MTDTQTRPRCRCCGKQLAKYTEYCEVPVDRATGEVPEAPDRFANRDVLQVTRKPDKWIAQHCKSALYNVWLGDYGVDGKGLFCSKTCGYVWATRVLTTTAELATHE